MANVADLVVTLELNDNEYTVKLRNAGKVVNQFKRQLEGTDRSVRRIEASVTGLLSKLRDVFVTLSMVRGAFHTTGQALFGWQKAIIDASAEMERITALMYGMSDAATEAEKSMEAAKDVDFAISFAENAPFQINAITDSMVKFKSVGLDPTDGSLRSLTDAVAAFGGNSDVLHRASVAIQQMAGKGVISMEELRQQLGEAVPEAIRLMARGVGMSYGDLVATISKGQVKAGGALARMFQEFELEFGGSGERMMQTWNGMVQQLQTRWMLFKKDIGDAGYFDAVKAELRTLIDFMGDDRMKLVAKEIGEALAASVRQLKAWGTALYENWDTIKNVTVAAGSFFAVFRLSGYILGAARALGIFKAATVATNGAFVLMSGGLSRYRTGTTLATAGTTMLTASIRKLGVVIRRNPIGVIAFGLASAAAAASYLEDELESARETVERFKDVDGLGATKQDVQEVTEYVKALQEQIAGKQQFIDENWYKFMYGEQVRLAREGLKQQESDLEDALRVREQMVQASLRRETQEFETQKNEQLRTAMDTSRREMSQRSNALFKSLEAGDLDQAEYFAKREEAIGKMIAAQRAAVAQAMTDVQDEMWAAAERGDPNLGKYEHYLTVLSGQMDELNQKYVKFLDLNSKTELLGGKDSAAIKRGQKLLDSLQGRIAQLDAQTDNPGAPGYFEKLWGAINAGQYGSDEHILNQILLAVEELETKTAELKFEKKMRELAEATANANDEFFGLFETLSVGEKFQEQLDNGVFGDPRRLSDAAKAALRDRHEELDFLKANVELTQDALDANQAYVEARKRQAQELIWQYEEETRSLETGLLERREAIQAQFDYEVQQRREQLNNEHLTDQERRQLYERFARWYEARTERLRRDLEGPIAQMARQWARYNENMEQAGAGWLDDFSNRLTEFVRTGKASFSDFAESIIEDIIRIQIQAQLAGLIGGASGGFSVTEGIAGQTNYGGGALGVVTGNEFDTFATGGIMTAHGKLPLRAYSAGGIANSPQLALFGEGRTPEAYVPLPDGKNIPVMMKGGVPNVSVNVINQSGQPVDAQGGQPRFDGEKMVLDVVLKAANRPGPFRDGMRGAMK